MPAPPLVSCIMPTANRRAFVPAAIACFLGQDYPERELLILDDGTDCVRDLVPADPRIRYVPLSAPMPLGAKRNRACELAGGDLIVHWDDDDWYPPDRITRQADALLRRGGDLCGSSKLYFRDAAARRAWEYEYRCAKGWVAGSTLAYRKSSWAQNRFRDIQVGEDSFFVWGRGAGQLIDLADSALCVATIHETNTSPKRPTGALWRAIDPAAIGRVIEQAERKRAPATTGPRPRALVAAAAGIGDVIRATPLVRVLDQLGFTVDVLLNADYAETASLLHGAPEIARVIVREPAPNGTAPAPVDLSAVEYEVACFTTWAAPLERQVRARTRRAFDRATWLREGDSHCVERLARELGWQGEMPDPFVVTASRSFDLPAGTLAIHAGCKKGWPWKKWHGFAELADQIESVAVIGTAEDLDQRATYFGEAFRWPPHVRDYVGALSLPETAALIRQCAALVCNDSGMQHVGAAVGTPTYPIFGLTSPRREALPLAHVHPITKGLSCEPACRLEPWGRRDCHRHLECLRTMTATEVLERIDGRVARRPSAARRDAASVPPLPNETVAVAVVTDGGIGDILLASPVLERLFDDAVRCEIDVYCHQPEAARFIFGNARFVRAVHPAALLRQNERHYDLTLRTLQFVRYGVRDSAKIARVAPEFASRLAEAAARLARVHGLAQRQPAMDGLWGRLSVRAQRNYLDNMGFLGAVDVDRESELFLAPDPAAHAALEKHVGAFGHRYVTLHDGFDNTTAIPPGAATKCWPMDNWRRLIDEMRSRHPDVALVQVGGKKSRNLPGVDVSLAGRTSLHEVAWIVKNAQLHIDTDSGLVHMARALHTPAVVMFGPTDSEYYGHAANTNLTAGKCGNCWWSTPDWLARCPRGLAVPECMESVAPADVVAAASRMLAARAPSRGRASEVACYDGALCARGRDRLARMCERLDLPMLPISQHIKNERSGVYIHASKQWEYLYAIEALDTAYGPDSKLRIADLGGGRGALGPYLGREGHDVHVIDLDFLWDHGGDPTVELRFRRWARALGVRARFGSLYNVPAASGTFDVVTCTSVVEHLPYKQYVLAEALRILKPGGLLVLTCDFANSPERFEDGMRREIFSPRRLTDALAAVGVQCLTIADEEVERSARRIQSDGVCGIPEGMTVAGITIRKE
jgi:ADP-heptose:LPS heptosyltransferase/SAM-dependent methyltransferase